MPMGDLVLTTFDWVPEPPRGYVRDLRVRWALEEAGLLYRVESTPFRDRGPDHFAHQPFGQVPWLTDGDLSIFESGAILLHLGELSDKLMSADPRGRGEVKQWLFAALASVEAASQPWSFFMFSGDTDETPMRKFFDAFQEARETHTEQHRHTQPVTGAERAVGPVGVAEAVGKLAQPGADAILDKGQALLGPGLVALHQPGDGEIQDRRLHRAEGGEHPSD